MSGDEPIFELFRKEMLRFPRVSGDESLRAAAGSLCNAFSLRERGG